MKKKNIILIDWDHSKFFMERFALKNPQFKALLVSNYSFPAETRPDVQSLHSNIKLPFPSLIGEPQINSYIALCHADHVP